MFNQIIMCYCFVCNCAATTDNDTYLQTLSRHDALPSNIMPNKTPGAWGVAKTGAAASALGRRARCRAVGDHAAQEVHELGDFVGRKTTQMVIQRQIGRANV